MILKNINNFQLSYIIILILKLKILKKIAVLNLNNKNIIASLNYIGLNFLKKFWKISYDHMI